MNNGTSLITWTKQTTSAGYNEWRPRLQWPPRSILVRLLTLSPRFRFPAGKAAVRAWSPPPRRGPKPGTLRAAVLARDNRCRQGLAIFSIRSDLVLTLVGAMRAVDEGPALASIINPSIRKARACRRRSSRSGDPHGRREHSRHPPPPPTGHASPPAPTGSLQPTTSHGRPRAGAPQISHPSPRSWRPGAPFLPPNVRLEAPVSPN